MRRRISTRPSSEALHASRASSILCAALVAGLSWLAADLAASTYHWNTSVVLVKKQAAAASLAFSAEGTIVLLVNRRSQVDELTVRQLARIYSGEVTEWPNGDAITAINRPIESDIRRGFYRLVLNANPTQKFFQTGSPIPFETMRVDSDGAIARFVSRDKGAIGYCYAPCGNASVKVLRIEGRSPEDQDYALK